MQITPTEQSGLTHRFSVVVPASDVEAQLEAELQSIGKKVKMPGFRAGKIPLPVLKKRYGQEVMGDVLQSTVNKATREVVESKNLRPALQPDVKITQFEEGGDLSLEIAFEVMPVVPEVDYAAVSVDELTFELPEKDVADGLARLAKSRQHPHTKDGAAVLGDVVKIDFLGKKDGVPFSGGEAKGFSLELGSGQFIPGFEEQLVGAKAGDKRLVTVKFPEAYHSADLAGADATFDVTVHEVSYLHVPDVNDKLATQLGFDDLAALTKAVAEQISSEYNQVARSKAKKQLFDKLDAAVKFDVPQNMIKLEMEGIWKQVEEAKKAGDPELAKKSDDELKTEYELIAKRRVKLGILLSEIGRANNLQITREELSAAVMNHARNYPGQEDKVFEFYRKNPAQVDELRGPILEEKAVDFILSKVNRLPKAIAIDELLRDDDADADADSAVKKTA
jgi:trigger factor